MPASFAASWPRSRGKKSSLWISRELGLAISMTSGSRTRYWEPRRMACSLFFRTHTLTVKREIPYFAAYSGGVIHLGKSGYLFGILAGATTTELLAHLRDFTEVSSAFFPECRFPAQGSYFR